MDERLNKVLEELKRTDIGKEEIISLLKEAFRIIDDEYEEKKNKSLETESQLRRFLNKWGKLNSSIVEAMGGYLCSQEKKKTIENSVLDFLFQSLNTEKSEASEKDVSKENESDKYEEKYYEALDKIKFLSEENRKNNSEIEEIKKQNIKSFQKILGMIGSEPKNDIDEKIVKFIEDLYEDDSIQIVWSTDKENEKNIFDVLKTTLEIENEVRLPALISDKVIIEKGLIYRKEK